MTEPEAWQVLDHFAGLARISISRAMTVNQLRRSLAKRYQPRRASDDSTAMSRINPAIDVIDAERDRRELLGVAEPARQPAAAEPWQTEPDVSETLEDIQRSVYQRAVKFGRVELVKAWAWDGKRFRKVLSAQANEWASEELGRGLLRWLAQERVPYRCEAVFVTHGSGRANRFRLILLRVGKGYDNVSSYDFAIDIEPDDPTLAGSLNRWLEKARHRLFQDESL